MTSRQPRLPHTTRQASLAGLVLSTLAACGGSTSDSDPVNSPPSPVAVDNLSLSVEAWQRNADQTLTVTFLATNQDGESVAGLRSAAILSAQLLPEGFTGAGNSSQWQFLLSEFCVLDGDCPGELSDEGDGLYRYQTAATLEGYNGEATQRIVVKVGGDTLVDGTEVPVTNGHVDFTPPDRDPFYTRDLVATETCEACHESLGNVFHSGFYTELETCSVCHNPSRINNPANSLSGLAHRVHNDANLAPLVTCDSCHNPDNGLANTTNWATKPSQLACGSCHTNIDFATGEGHIAQADNASCTACHQSDDTRAIHLNLSGQEALAQFSAEIIATEADAAAGTLSVNIALGNPTNGAPYDSPEQLPFLAALRLAANWGTSVDYTQAFASLENLHLSAPIESLGDGQYRYQLSGLDFTGATDGGTLSLDGALCHDNGNLMACADNAAEVALKARSTAFSLQGLDDSVARRSIVSNDTCGNCHGDQQLDLSAILASLHANANDLSQQCQLCHNANQPASATADNQSASSANFNHLVHGIHAGVRAGYEDVVYPADIANCRACHIQDDTGDSFALPLDAGVPPLAVNDGTYTSPVSANCRTCHNSETATTHILDFGGVISGSQEAASAAETCDACHGPGGFVDVAEVHGLN